MTKSGRGVWWEVYPLDSAGPAVVAYKPAAVKRPKWAKKGNTSDLEKYIAERALKGCPDCLAAIMECPEDNMLQDHVRNSK